MQRRLSPGDGELVASLDPSSRAHLSTVQFSYPLKLIVPARRFLPAVQCAYVIGYGGGLVAGDRVRLRVEVGHGATLVLLTQGSTKVFKVRPGRYLTAPELSESSTTQQLYRLSVLPSATLVVLPAPVTCFSRARYAQRQAVRLADASSSLVLLDWYTSGRMALGGGDNGEAWEFERYKSENEVWLGGRRIAKDVLLLEDETPSPPTAIAAGGGEQSDGHAAAAQPQQQQQPETTYRARAAPYACYATLFLFGPACTGILASVAAEFAALVQHKQRAPFSLVWSFSPLAGHPAGGGIARCAGDSTEAVREWVTHVLQQGGIEDIIGRDLWKSAFS
ncbi:hypothetical protein JCM3770_001856 [Rhodotorula araucariae]